MLGVVLLEKLNGSKNDYQYRRVNNGALALCAIRGQFHQHHAGSFCAMRFTPNLLAYRVVHTAYKLSLFSMLVLPKLAVILLVKMNGAEECPLAPKNDYKLNCTLRQKVGEIDPSNFFF
jgi:hypothetical protein